MAGPRLLPLVDQILGGNLRTFLADRRNRGDSFNTIASALAAEHGIAVTAETVRLWCQELHVTEKGSAA